LTVLVVSCPCALGIGTPLATTIAISRAAEEGILIRSTAILERLSAINTVVFDKTGTLTEGNLTVASVVPQRCTPVELLSIAASLESNSEHLIGKAIVKYAAEKKVPLHECRNAIAIPGRGLEGEIRFYGKWKKVIAGNEKLMVDRGVTRDVGSNDSVSAGTLFVAWDGTVQGVIRMSDALRFDAISAGKMLHERGVDVGILSGDIQAIVDSIGGRINAHYSFGGLLPKEKVEKIQMLRSGGRSVLMVGDGINDAPALASSDVGVALGSATDLTKENADITIIGTRLERIPWLLQLGKKTYGIIQWNLFWAFVYNIVGIFLAAFGLLDPILAALAMIISSVFIIFNSRRLSND
jgi:Cu+-exporting ATPase